jgi:hypothetical protein
MFTRRLIGMPFDSDSVSAHRNDLIMLHIDAARDARQA